MDPWQSQAAKHLAVELSRHVLMTYICQGQDSNPTFSLQGKHSTEPLQQYKCLYITCLVSWQWRPMLYGVTCKQADLLTLNYWPTCMPLNVSLVHVHVNEITRMCSKDRTKANRNRKKDRLTDICVLLRFRSNSTSLGNNQEFIFQK